MAFYAFKGIFLILTRRSVRERPVTTYIGAVRNMPLKSQNPYSCKRRRGKEMPPISRAEPSKTIAQMTVDEAVEADRRYFDEHPEEDEYIREFVPGEFGNAELP
jgi:hypothetical protein